MKDNIKINILGDLMCDNALLKAAKTETGYDFTDVFINIKKYLDNADLTIANFETVMTGKEPYRAYSAKFNTPDEFAISAKKAGVDVMITANNHAMDQEIEGLVRTKKKLEEIGFKVFGTLDNRKPMILNVNDVNIGLLAYTEPLNFRTQKDFKGINIDEYINLLAPIPTMREFRQDERSMYTGIKGAIRYYVRRIIKTKPLMPIKTQIDLYRIRKVGVSLGSRTDILRERHKDPKYLQMLTDEVNYANKNSDVTLVFPHAGGQINEKPGPYIKFLKDFFKGIGAKNVIFNHPHVIQEASYDRDFLYTASIGSVSHTPDGEYRDNPLMPYYSMMLNIYIDRETKEISDVTYSILRAIADERRYVYVYNIKDLWDEREDLREQLEEDSKKLYKTIHNKDVPNDYLPILEEFKL